MTEKIRVGFLHSLIRKDEKFLLDEFRKRKNVELIMIDDRKLNFDLHKNNFQYDVDKLIVKEAYCGKQIVMKRFRPRAKGRAAPIKKPYSNLTIILSEMKKVEKHGTKS